MASPDLRERILDEVARLEAEIQHCAHCAALREQMIHLLNMLPRDPILVRYPIERIAERKREGKTPDGR